MIDIASRLTKRGRIWLAALGATLAFLPSSLLFAQEAEGVIYASHFEREGDLAKWVGRPGAGKGDPKLTAETEGAKEEGKPYLSVTADGKLGSGFRLKPLPLAKAGKTCVLSFWFKSAGRFPVTYHLTGAAPGSNGEASGAWHSISFTDGWVEVSYGFLPTTESVGLEVAAGAEDYEPAKMALYGVQLKQP